MQEESEFVRHHDELLAISEPKSPLRRCFEDKFVHRFQKYLGLFRRIPLHSTHIVDDYTSLTSDKTINLFASVTIFLTAAAMLIVPLWIL